MSEDVEFCAILTIRYLNPMLMGSAHDWVAQNMPSEMPQGFLRSRSFHIAPDRGMTILWFDKQKNLDAAFPFLKSFQQEIAKRFEANCNAQKGITSPELNAG
jgi:hypothetical protein